MTSHFSAYLLAPLFLGLIYSVAAMAFKRALDLGAHVLHTLFFTNLCMAVFAVPLWFRAPARPDADLFGPAFVIGLLFFAGMGLNLLALQKGDVSVAAPVMGAKAVMVAAFTVLFISRPVRPALWAGAVMTAVALALLRDGGGRSSKRFFITLVPALGSCAAFALCDVLFQVHARKTNGPVFIAVVLWTVLVLSGLLVPFFPKGKAPLGSGAKWWLAAGCVLNGVQAMGMITCVSFFNHPNAAAAVNIVYNSRGIWSVALVWTLGRFFGNRERQLGADVMARRLAGASLLLAAIAITLVFH